MSVTRDMAGNCKTRPKGKQRKTTGEPPDTSDPRSDHELVQRCISGEVAAWEQLYRQYQPPLLSYIHSVLKRNDPDLADELAARVWYALVDHDGELLTRYDPQRGTRLITFIRAIAKDRICRYFRSEKRRRTRETLALAQSGREYTSPEMYADAALSEFLETLTPREREYADEYLLVPAGVGEIPP